ncbi:MAG: uncharacterized protein H6Q89_5269 [Myxococcaceae bacterium]|nr:uncharacterized protein [Myxococcaceae bacterium]
MRHTVLSLLLFSGSALAGSVYLNGVKIDGVTNQKFEKATVRIDEKGNVLIEAPGYAVKQVEGGPSEVPVSNSGMIQKQYFLVTEQNVVGMSEYDIDLYVNSKWVRKLKSAEDQIVSEITRNLVPGKNTVMFIAKKVAPEARKSLSSNHFFRIIIGEGTMSGDHVMIDNPVVRFERTAANTDDVSKEFSLTAR